MIYISNDLFLTGAIDNYANENNPIIGYHSVLQSSDFSQSGTVSAISQTFPVANLWSPDTSSVWKGEEDEDATLVFANGNNETVDYFAIAKHNLYSAKYTFVLQYESGGSWFDIQPERLVSNDNAILVYFDAVSYSQFRVVIGSTTGSTGNPILAHVKLGRALVLQRRIFSGHKPATLSPMVKKTTYGSESGQYLGQVVHRSYYKSECQQENNSPQFIRDKIVPFINHCNGHTEIEGAAPSTFFFSWRPGTYPDEVIYGWTDDNINPEIQGGDQLGGRMKWGCSIEAVA